jgi:hypothetical protein
MWRHSRRGDDEIRCYGAPVTDPGYDGASTGAVTGNSAHRLVDLLTKVLFDVEMRIRVEEILLASDL